jgi:CheY-like chemotaxis protein
MLERLGFEILTAEDGVSALQRLEEHRGPVSAVLLDLSMPRMGGAEALLRIRERHPDVPVILMSGYTEQDVASRMVDETKGVVAFLQKPFLPEDLTSALRKLSRPPQT